MSTTTNHIAAAAAAADTTDVVVAVATTTTAAAPLAGPSLPSSSEQEISVQPPPPLSSSSSSLSKPPRQPKTCAACCSRIEGGQFVRAVGRHYHLECFRCQECNQVVADKFFPVTTDGITKIYCETDYFRRLDLTCAKCGLALRGPYINALNRKYHMEHFTCSVCPTAFRQYDSYYERDGQVFCGYHYSIFHAAKCGGCHTAVLKNFVEINKDQISKQWHPPCYMIYKLWSAQLSVQDQLPQEDSSTLDPEVEVQKQQAMVEWGERILQVLSAFEESAAACISEMLLHFSNENNIQCVLQAARFIQHVDILFSTIESINKKLVDFSDSSTLQQTKEPKQLVKKIFYFFTNLSGRDTSVRQRATLGLIQQVTSLAHTLKKVIRTAFAAHASADAVAGAERLSRFQRFINLLWCTWSRLCLWLKIDEKHLLSVSSYPDADGYRDQNSSDDENRQADGGGEEFFDEDGEYTPSAKGAATEFCKAPFNWSSSNESDVFLSELSGLQHLAVRQLASLALHPLLEQYFNLNQLLEVVDAPKVSVWSKMVGAMKAPKKRLRGTFCVPLEELVEQTGAESNLGVGPGSVRIPMIMDHCVRTLKQKDLSTEGIFRKNGNIRRLKEVCERINKDPKDIDLSDDHPIQIAALMKKFLRDLPDPLLTFKLKDLFTASQKLESEADRLLTVRLICCLLPKPNLELLAVLSRFFNEVASCSENSAGDGVALGGNKMHIENIATVIAPNILYSKSSASPEESVLAVRAVWMILENVPDMFKVPEIILGKFKEEGPHFNPASNQPEYRTRGRRRYGGQY
ncbi:hypothetical protein BASA50_001059 [Batrachochytrium salamandrivorans]|uniref:Rho-GAP domain-containing protein n=1 Tax=Batrachochytrium salamandrivorans TaxID=1357716 RepID=A0ABQ8ES87_9FUNG|nr:hypothetical protein BASA50_001059 [Batrachochytrium salamandrivorans]KAH6588212.1 hypothetical protein BASA61_006021 [Batrachochytrium salamandrivorans]